MEEKTRKLSPTAPLLENINLKQRLENQLNDVNAFNTGNNNIKKMITYFKGKNYKSNRKNKKYKTLSTIIKIL